MKRPRRGRARPIAQILGPPKPFGTVVIGRRPPLPVPPPPPIPVPVPPQPPIDVPSTGQPDIVIGDIDAISVPDNVGPETVRTAGSEADSAATDAYAGAETADEEAEAAQEAQEAQSRTSPVAAISAFLGLGALASLSSVSSAGVRAVSGVSTATATDAATAAQALPLTGFIPRVSDLCNQCSRDQKKKREEKRKQCRAFIKIPVRAHTKKICASDLPKYAARQLRREGIRRARAELEARGVPGYLTRLPRIRRPRIPDIRIPSTPSWPKGLRIDLGDAFQLGRK